MWIMPPSVAEGIRQEETGNLLHALNAVDTESEDAHLSFGVWYAGLGSKESSKYTINNVTVFYAADDKNNEKKLDMFEDSIDVVIGESETLTVNIPNCTGTMADRTVAGVAADKDDALKLVITGKNVGSSTLTVTTPGGQTKEVTVNVLPQQTTVTTTETTTTTTTTSATTTTTEKITTTVGSTETTTTTEEVIIPLYGDVNCDSRVDITDAVMLNKAIAGVVTLGTRQQKAIADCDGDGEIASNDAVALLKFLVSLVKQLPYAD